MRPNGHKILITGGGRGIGRALGDCFASQGNELIIVGRNRPADLPPHMLFIGCDLADANARSALIEEIKENHSDLSVLINNAGMQHEGRFGETWHYADYAPEMATNMDAVVDLSDGLLPLLKAKPEAAIVNISSALAIQPKQDAPIYCASKAFIRSFSKCLRYQLQDTCIRVIDVVPPLVDTDMTRGRQRQNFCRNTGSPFWRAWCRDKTDIYIGKAGILNMINRLSPRLAARIVRHG